jgi:hypothetical protein
MSIPTRLGRELDGRRSTTTTASAMSQDGEPHEHARAGLAVLKRNVALLDDDRSTDSGWS